VRFEHALAPGAIGTLELPNRIVMGSMHLGIEGDGDALVAFYSERARGGAGLMVTGGSAVSKAGAGGRNYSFVNEPSSQTILHRLTQAVHAANGRIALQLFHAGRYAFFDSFGLQPVAPSAIPSRFSRDAPRALNEDEILETIGDFARGAQQARALGFDGVEVMASEGYLINQFLSPLTNRRGDAWGGSFERRIAFARAVLREIRRSAGPDFPVIFRISGADLMEGSTTADETLAFARTLAGDGVDALNVGIGWHESAIPTVQQVVPSGVWVRYATAIKAVVGTLPVIVSNRINSIAMANGILGAGGVDFVSMARPFLADPAIVGKAARGQISLVNTCIACNQACIDRSIVDERVSCMVNPRAGRELQFPEDRAPATPQGRFAVIGAGPAGMEAARALATLGHRVELFEAEDEIGGQFRMARRIPGKHDFGETIRYFTSELARLGAIVHLGNRLRADAIGILRAFDGIVIATGVVPRPIRIEGAALPHVVSYADALLRDRSGGNRVAIVGAGGIGVDLAHWLSFGDANADAQTRFLYEHGLAAPEDGTLLVTGRKSVVLMRRGTTIGERIGKTTRWTVVRALRAAGVQIYPRATYEAIVPDGIRIRDADGNPQTIGADTVIVAAGQERNDALIGPIAALGIPYRVAGGARDAAELDAVRAFEEGLRAAHELANGVVSARTAPGR
jgi:2,4-dienoyl-CoA reductase (NADPH2)